MSSSSKEPAAFIAADWGTSNLRLALCDARGSVLDSRSGPGAADSRGRFAEVFDTHTAEWRDAHGALPAILSGMAGSSFGWREAPYLPCPAELAELADQVVTPRAGAFIVPGMRCSNPLGAPDVMRGEETQLIGALEIEPALAEGRHLVCLPGTHAKWVSMRDGIVQEFLTVPTGEIFSLLCEHSVLVRDPATPLTHHGAEFERGLAESARHPEVPLLHRLFQSRSLRLDRQLSAEGAASWVSGLLIGTDVGGALPLFEQHDAATTVHLVGAPRLCESYAIALARRGRKALSIDGGSAALRGQAFVYRALEAASA
jgi:2-dehydro-3-deoxygalactonokinase